MTRKEELEITLNFGTALDRIIELEALLSDKAQFTFKDMQNKLTEAKKIIYELLQIGVFQFPFQDDEANYLNKQITAKAEAFLKE